MQRPFLLVSAVLLLCLPACSLVGGGEDTEDYNPGIESLGVPDQVAAGEEFRVQVALSFGSQNCTELKAIDVAKSEERAIIEVTARRYPDRVCADMPVSIDTTLTLAPPYADPFTVVGDQPDGADLTREVAIR